MGATEALSLFFEPVRYYVQSNPFIYAVVVFILAILIARGLSIIIHGISKKALRHTKKSVDSKIFIRVEGPVIILIILVITHLALQSAAFTDRFLLDLTNTFIIIMVAYMLIQVINVLLETWSHRMSNKKGSEFHEEVLPLTKGGAKVLVTLVAVIFIFEVWNIDIGPLMVSLGVGGAILGLAFQDSLKNSVGGIALIMDRSFKRGDVIKLDSGELGEVIEVNLRSTKMKNYDNEIMIIPNGLLANSRFTNLAQPTDTLRIVIDVAVAYGSDPDNVKEVLLSALHNHPHVLKYPKRDVRFYKMADFSLDFKLIFYINNYKDMFKVKNEITNQVYKELYRAGISIPFPARTIYQGKPQKYTPPALPKEDGLSLKKR